MTNKRSIAQKKYWESINVISKLNGISRKTAQAVYRYRKAKNRSEKMKAHWQIAKSFKNDMIKGTQTRARVDYSIGKSRKIATYLAKGYIPVHSDKDWEKQTVVDILAKNKGTGETSVRTVTVSGLKNMRDSTAVKSAVKRYEDAKRSEASKEWEIQSVSVTGYRINRRVIGGTEGYNEGKLYYMTEEDKNRILEAYGYLE